MTTDIPQFWKLLSESGLVNAAEIQELNVRFQSEQTRNSRSNNDEKRILESENLAKWLVRQKVLSEFQSNILLKGASGPFKYGNYIVVGRVETGPFQGSFQAINQFSRHPVLLQFLSGENDADLEIWNQKNELVESVSQLRHPSLSSTFEAVVMPNYRFIVSELPTGKPLCERVPRNARMPWENAARVVGQVALGLSQLHQNGISHQSISPRTIWVSSKIPAQLRLPFLPDSEFAQFSEVKIESAIDYLAPERLGSNAHHDSSDLQANQSSDVYSLGCVLYRLISGRVLFGDVGKEEKITSRTTKRPTDLTKFEVSAELNDITMAMLELNPKKRPDLKHVVTTLREIIGEKMDDSPDAMTASKSLKKYESWLQQFQFAPQKTVLAAPEIREVDTATSSDHAPGETTTKKQYTPRRKSKWILPITIACTLLVLATAIVSFAYLANRTDIGQPVANGATTNASDSDTETSVPPKPKGPEILIGGQFAQELIADDGASLWETPTLGEAIDFSYLPPAPKLVFVFRPSEILADPEGTLLLDSLGPDMKTIVDSWQNKTGLSLDQVSQLIISMHTTDGIAYEPFFVVTLNDPQPRERLLELWNKPKLEELESGAKTYAGTDGQTYHFTEGDSTPETTSKFIIGSPESVLVSADLAGANVLSGPIKTLAATTDRDRHFTFLFLRNSLFNDEGQKLMGAKMSVFNRELNVAIRDEIRGGLVSLHLENGSFLETRFDHTPDIKPGELRDWFDGTIRQTRDRLTQTAANIPANQYWDKVRLRYDNMISDVYRNLRIGVENKSVVANCWLAPVAAHNVLAASELLLTYSGSSSVTVAAAPKTVPQSIEDLLAAPRNLTVTTNPDLNILLSEMESEIRDDHGNLPFPFEIKMLGNDLLLDGITKNQRPGDFDLQQKPLSEILTEIVLRANPTKDISGPSDPNCKLIWVVGPDPDDAARKIILITTRDGAASKSYNLPTAFQLQ